MPSEKSALLHPSNANGFESSKYYFLGHKAGTLTSESVVDDDGIPVIETLPEGTTEEEFAPRIIRSPIGKKSKKSSAVSYQSSQPQAAATSDSSGDNFFTKLFGGGEEARRKERAAAGTLIKPRKVPVKVEPKVFFANERTFLAWMHISVMLAAASISIMAFAQDQNPFSQMYGVVLLPVAIAFMGYSLYQFLNRAYMIRNRMPGPYGATTGPKILGIMLMISIVAQFSLKVYSMRNF